MTLEELNVIIDAKLDPYKKAMSDMKKVTEQATKPVKDNIKSVNDTVNHQTGGIRNALMGLGKIAAFGLLAKKMYDFGKYSVQTALEVSASMNQIRRLMGESTQSFLKWSKGGALAYNLATGDAIKYGAVYSNLFSNFIKDNDQLAAYTVQMLKTSAVVASATGRTMDDVMNRIRSGMLGSTEAIEDLGINVNVSMLKTTKAFQELANGRSWEQLDFNTQQAIRMMGILEQASTKFGNNLMQGPTTSIAYFVALLKNAALNIGNAFLPVISAIMPALSAFASVVNKATGALAVFMQLLFGKKASASPMSSMANDVKGVGGGLDKANNGAGKLGKGLGGAGKQAKALKKELLGLMGFDEINLLSKDKSDSGAGGGSGGGGGGGGGGGSGAGGGGGITLPKVSFDDALEDEDDSKIKKFLEDLIELLRPTIEALQRLNEALQPLKEFVAQGLIDFYEYFLKPVGLWVLGEGLPRFIDIISKTLNNIDFPKINRALREFWQALAPFTINIGEGLLWFLDNVLSPLTSWTISDIVPIFIKAVARSIEFLNSVISAFAPFGKWLFDKFLAPLARWTGGVITKVLEGIVEALKKVSDWCKEHKSTVETMTAAIGSFLAAWGIVKVASIIYGIVTALYAFVTAGTTAGVVGSTLGMIITTLTSPFALVVAAIGALIFIGYELWKNWDTIVNYLSELWQGFCDFVGGICESIGAFFVGLWTGVVETFQSLYNDILAIFSGIGDWFNGIWTNVKTIFTNAWNAIFTFLSNIITKIYNWISERFTAVKDFISNIWNGIKDVISTIAGAIWEGIKSVFTGIYTTVSSIFTSIKTVASSIWEGIKSTVVSVASGMWSAVTSKMSDIYNAVSEWFGKIPSKVSELWDKAVRAITSIDLYSIGRNIIVGLISGIGSMARAVWDKAKSIAKGIADTIKGWFGINSPSKLTTSFGRFIGQGLYLGLDKEETNVFNSAKGLNNSVLKGLNNSDISVNKNVEVDIFADFKNAMGTMLNSLANMKNNALSGSGDIIVQIGDTEFGRFAINKINEEQERAGMTLIKI